MTSFVDDYEFGQVVMREMTGGKIDPTSLDPALVERVGNRTRPAIEQAAEEFMAIWQAVPWRVRVRLRVYAWVARKSETHG